MAALVAEIKARREGHAGGHGGSGRRHSRRSRSRSRSRGRGRGRGDTARRSRSRSRGEGEQKGPDSRDSSTNVYIRNLALSVTEGALLQRFGRYGPLVSVKIMWPRRDEDLRVLSGFVARQAGRVKKFDVGVLRMFSVYTAAGFNTRGKSIGSIRCMSSVLRIR